MAPVVPAESPSIGVKIMSGERVVFVEESGPDQYLKLVAAGQMDETLLEALEDYVKRQKKRLQTQTSSTAKEAAETLPPGKSNVFS
jgi:hypothetical protein